MNPSESWLTKIFNFVLFATYNAIRATRADGDQKALQTDSTGALLVRTVGMGEEGAVQEDDPPATGYVATRVIRPGGCGLRSLFGFNNGGSTRYVCIFDAVGAPSNGSNIPISFPVDAGKPFSIDFVPARRFASGVTVAISSTGDSYTADSGATFRFNGRTET